MAEALCDAVLSSDATLVAALLARNGLATAERCASLHSSLVSSN
jgi:hypothetical protein